MNYDNESIKIYLLKYTIGIISDGQKFEMTTYSRTIATTPKTTDLFKMLEE